MKGAGFWSRAAAGGLAAALLVAVVVAFVGQQLAESKPALSPSPTPPAAPLPAPPDPSALVWPTGQPLPSPTIGPPMTIVVKGKEIVLDQGVKAEHPLEPVIGWEVDGSVFISYRSGDEAVPFSWLALDGDGNIIASYIPPSDMPVFQAVLDTAGPPPAPIITIARKEIQLVSGMRVSENLLSQPGKKVWTIHYYPIPGRTQGPDPVIVIAEDGTIMKQNIQPSDVALFQALLDASKPAQ